jgi:hypothetical protein
MSFEPCFTEINLDAEIGSYHDDFSDVPGLSAVPEREDDPEEQRPENS